MQRLGGGSGTSLPYPFYGVVRKKYAPKYESDKFFVELLLDGPGIVKAMVNVRHFGAFEIGDTIAFYARRGGEWLSVTSRCDLIKVAGGVVQVQEISLELDYVSVPRHVGDEVYFLSKTDRGWMRVDGQVMAAYFMGADVTSVPRYYLVLEIKREATADEIHRAFRRLAKRWHPDVCHEEQAEERFKQINEAYQELSDLYRRGLYDRQAWVDVGQRREVTHWPGNGFGRLKAEAEIRGDTVIVRRILGWERRSRELDIAIPLSEVSYEIGGISFQWEGNFVYVHRERLPFEPSEALNRIKRKLEGSIRFVGRIEQSGGWDHEKSEVVYRWDIPCENVTAELDDETLRKMRFVIADAAFRARLHRAIRRYQEMGLVGQMELNCLALDCDVSVEQIIKTSWMEDYDSACFEALR